jgi:hypothetical protein
VQVKVAACDVAVQNFGGAFGETRGSGSAKDRRQRMRIDEGFSTNYLDCKVYQGAESLSRQSF